MKTIFVFYHASDKTEDGSSQCLEKLTMSNNIIQATVLSTCFDLLLFTCTPLTQAVINQRPGSLFPGLLRVFVRSTS